MEQLFGADLSTVRIHAGPEAAVMNARAFAFGENLYFDPAYLSWDSPAGRFLLAHEITHVLQQRAGVATAGQIANPTILDDPAFEAEADCFGRLAIAQHRTGGRPAGSWENASYSLSAKPVRVIQRNAKKEISSQAYTPSSNGTTWGKRGKPQTTTDFKNLMKHAERQAFLQMTDAPCYLLVQNAFPCSYCHNHFISQSKSYAIIIRVMEDQGGYSADHGNVAVPCTIYYYKSAASYNAAPVGFPTHPAVP